MPVRKKKSETEYDRRLHRSRAELYHAVHELVAMHRALKEVHHDPLIEEALDELDKKYMDFIDVRFEKLAKE